MAATEAQKRATAKYKRDNYKQINLELPITELEALDNHLKQTGEPRATFIRRIIRENIN